MSETRSYPRQVETDGGDIELRLMSRADEAAVLAFAQKLPTHDLLFLPRNISQPKVLLRLSRKPNRFIKEEEHHDDDQRTNQAHCPSRLSDRELQGADDLQSLLRETQY
jgi:hypothetical protein